MPRAVSTEDPEPATRNVALFFAFRDRTEENKGGSGNENKIGKETEEEDNPEYYPLSEYYPGVMHDWFEYPMVFYNVLDTKSVMWFLLNDVKETLGTEVTYVTDFDVSSDTLPPDDPDWLKGFTLDEQIIEGTEEDTGYSNLEYDPDGKLISGDWLGIDPAYMIGKYDDPNESQIFHGWHGKGYPDKRFDEMLIGDVPIVEDLVIDENGSTVSAAVITIPVEKDGFHFVVQPVEENGKIVYKLVFVPRLNQKGYDMKF
jgi:hypothetical protein